MSSDEENMSDEELHLELVVNLLRRPKIIRQQPNHFHIWDDTDFYARFRLSKASARMVLDLIAPAIKHPTTWNNCLIPETMFLLTLRFYATGSVLRTVGDFCGVSVSTASRVVAKVSHHIACLRDMFIKFPEDDQGKSEVMKNFYKLAKSPRVIAALDCTHVRMLSPGGENAEVYRNIKGFFPINVQTMCDSDLKILDIVGRWPGSSHDSTIFNNSRICSRFENGEFGDRVIVADSGYANKNYILTPLGQVTTRAENLYNESHIRTRNCVERKYEVWKRRFPILSIGMRCEPLKILAIIVATAILHNVCYLNKDREPPILDEDAENAVNVVLSVPHNREQNIRNNNIVRRQLIEGYFQNLV